MGMGEPNVVSGSADAAYGVGVEASGEAEAAYAVSGESRRTPMIGPQTLTIYQPVLSATGEELDGREQTWSSALGTIRVWMKQRQGGTRLSPLGATQAHAFSVRLNAPARLGTNLPQEGWRLVGQDGAEYIVRDAVWTGRLGRLTVERV